MVDNVSCVLGPAQPLVIIHHPHVSTASLSKGWGFRGMYRPTYLAASTLSLWVLHGREGHGRLVYIKYTWSIGNCATWCNIPAPSSCRSLTLQLLLLSFVKVAWLKNVLIVFHFGNVSLSKSSATA